MEGAQNTWMQPFPPPVPHFHPLNPMQPGYVPADTMDYSLDDSVEVKTASGHSYRVTEQIWSKMLSQWVPFTQKPSADVGNALFVVHHRRYTRDDSEEPFTIVDLRDPMLIDTLRPICTNVENMFQTRPSFEVMRVWPHIDAMRTKALEFDTIAARAGNDAESAATSAGLIRSFLELVESEFAPHREKLQRLLADGKITFNLMWSVFKPGTRIKQIHANSKETFGAILEDALYTTSANKKCLQLRGRTLKWDGKMFVTEPWVHDILDFDGPIALSNLSATVLTDAEHLELTDRGRIYAQYAGVHHIHNAGTIFVNAHTAGRPIAQDSGEVLAEGRAMLDTASFHKARPNPHDMGYIPPPQVQPFPSPQMHPMDARGPPHRPQVTHPPRESVPDEELWLLPPTLHGFSLVTKMWGEIRVKDIRPVMYDDKAWDRLVLDPEVKTLIRSLVDVRAAQHGAHILKDWIAGKGGGLVVLLHGVAGVGKTLTAEAVAEQLRRPLYVVGASELGTWANNVESALKAALELATRWGAVLLIDEADVYLERRSATDTMRNALVSSFLRMLEYHSGVLFLTTNRVKVFDEAILSRISIAIKYPELDLEQRSKIWWQFLHWVIANAENPHDLPEETKALLNDQNIKELALRPFNGRIIKNVVRTAQALAISSNEMLNMRHIRTVVNVTEKFLADTKDIKNDPPSEDENEVMSLA